MGCFVKFRLNSSGVISLRQELGTLMRSSDRVLNEFKIGFGAKIGMGFSVE